MFLIPWFFLLKQTAIIFFSHTTTGLVNFFSFLPQPFSEWFPQTMGKLIVHSFNKLKCLFRVAVSSFTNWSNENTGKGQFPGEGQKGTEPGDKYLPGPHPHPECIAKPHGEQ